jgi:hypothetical protein
LRVTQTVGRFVAQGVKVSNNYEITKLEISKLELKDGDVLAIKILGSAPASMADIQKIKSYIKAMLPNIQALVYSECEVELSIVSGTKTVNQIRRENGFAPIQGSNVYSKTRPTKRALDAAIALKNWLVRLFTPRQ